MPRECSHCPVSRLRIKCSQKAEYGPQYLPILLTKYIYHPVQLFLMEEPKSTSERCKGAPELDKPVRLTIRVLLFLFLIVKSEVKKQIGRR